ncbi:MAG: hypothetical protein WAJ85_00755 [Candidatus Baltobacteraceae bacterium]
MGARKTKKPILRLRAAAVFAAALAFVSPSLLHPGPAGATATVAGTVISNTATATFSDANSVGYASQSNTVSLTVWNAPALTNLNSTAQNVAPTDFVVTGPFTLTNTGNGTGYFALTQDAQFTGTVGASNVTLKGYVIVGGSTCTTGALCTEAQLNSALDSGSYATTAPNGTVQIEAEYQVASAPSVTSGTIVTTLTATVTYPATGAATQETSVASSAAETDTLAPDARLDLQKSVVAPASSSSNLVWTIKVNDGGGFPARDLTTVKTLLGASAAGIFITDKVPTFSGSALALVSAPSVSCYSGDTCTVYYSTNGTSWSATQNLSASYIGVFVYGDGPGSNVELPSAPSGSTGAGNVTTPQITITLTTVQPAGNLSANSNSVSNIANSVIGGNKDANLNVPVIGPTITVGTYDSSSPTLTGVFNNTTASSGTTPPGGASNIVYTQAYPIYSVLNGPHGVPGATGNYTGGTPVDNMHDFTEYGFLCSQTPTSTGTCSATGSIVIPMSIQNTGNIDDTFYPINDTGSVSGWTVNYYVATACSGGGSTFPTNCTQGAAITSSTPVSILSGATVNYEAVYTATAVSAFVPQTWQITVKGVSGSETNDTYDVLYPGGALKISKSVAATATNCPSVSSGTEPANGSTSGVCPGGVMTYTLSYQNLAPAGLAPSGAALGTEPAFATNAVLISSALLTEDGGASCSSGCTTYTNNWATNTFGLNAAPVDSNYGTYTTFTYSNGSAFAIGTYPGITAGYTKFTAALNATGTTNTGKVVAGQSGNITFTVTVR